MPTFKPRFSGVSIDHSDNSATDTALFNLVLYVFHLNIFVTVVSYGHQEEEDVEVFQLGFT